jgi:peptide/nickel transport system substrate-binding protein
MRRSGKVTAVGLIAVMVLGACGTSGSEDKNTSSAGFSECDSKPNTCNAGTTKPGGSLTLVIEKKLPNWNVFDSDGNTYETGQVMAGMLPAPIIVNPDSTVTWSRDLFVEEPKVEGESPMKVTLKIRPEAVWDDGTPISAKDFEAFWKWNNGRDCPDCTPAATAGYDGISAVTGSDNDRTVTLTFDNPYPDWMSLFNFLYPAHIAAKAGDLGTPAGLKASFDAFKAAPPTWSGGPFKIAENKQDESVTLVPNEKWYGQTKPSLEKVIFRIVEDQAQHPVALRNKEVQALLSQPNEDLVNQIKNLPGVNFNLAKGPNWEHVDANLENRFLKNMALRQAIFTAIDRKAIIERTVGRFFPGAEPLNNHIFMPGTEGYKDHVTATGQGSGDLDKAKKILTDAGYRLDGGKLITPQGEPVAPLRFRFTTGNALRQQTAELIQASLANIGVTITIDPTDRLGNTLETGDFDLIIFGWVGSSFTSDKKDLFSTNAGGNYGNWSNKEADALMEEGARTLDAKKARDLFNQADEIMTREAYNLPLFQKAVLLAVYSDFANVRNNATSAGPTYNMQEWGLRA